MFIDRVYILIRWKLPVAPFLQLPRFSKSQEWGPRCGDEGSIWVVKVGSLVVAGPKRRTLVSLSISLKTFKCVQQRIIKFVVGRSWAEVS